MSTLLRLAYDGTDFHGFARQDQVRTVQGELEAALGRIYKAPIRTRGASRTDAGVHARGQIVAFDPPFEIPTRGLLLGLAANLPDDLIAGAAWVVANAEINPDGAPIDPRHCNAGKLYRYCLRKTSLRDPISARFEWHLPRPLDIEAMVAAAPRLVGEHDFAGFRAADCQAKTTIRRVRGVELRVRTLAEIDPLTHVPGRIDRGEDPAQIEFDVRGDAFLKNMVRIMVGTLVAVGRGQFGAERIDEVLASGDRTRAGTTAPACGLTLVEVLWPHGGQKVDESGAPA